MSFILNVLNKVPGFEKYITIDPATFGNGTAPTQGSATVQDPDKNWRVELEELSRRFQGLPSTELAERQLASLEDSIGAAKKDLAAKASEAKKALETPFLSRLDQTHIQEKIGKVERDAAELDRGTRFKLAQAKALVETAKAYNPLRPRFEELRKRAQDIDKAVSRV